MILVPKIVSLLKLSKLFILWQQFASNFKNKILIQNRRMLPTLKVIQSKCQIQAGDQQMKKSMMSKSARATEQALYYEQKCQAQMTLNAKLKELLDNIKADTDTYEKVFAQEKQIKKVLKDRKKEQIEAQHQAHILNILISENGKLKEQVDSERNKRAIYFNVYKNLEHQIHHWQVKYKNLLIEIIKSQGAIEKIKEKYRKASKRVEKDIQTINNQIENLLKVEQNEQKVQQKLEKAKSSREGTGVTFYTGQRKETKIDPIESNLGEQKSLQLTLSQTKKQQEQQYQYEIQQKSVEFNGALARLRQISKLNNLEEIVRFFQGIQQQIEYQFGLFKEEERREKEICQRISVCKKQIQKIEAENEQRKSTKVVKREGEDLLQQKERKIKELQKRLEERIGVKASQMSNEMLLHHCLRVRDQKKQGKKNLEKYLQQAKKEKPEATILLNPRQMHKKIIQSQTSMI